MARKTKEEAEKTREALIYHALHLFSQKGVSQTRLADIAAAAGVTKGAFYWHFDSKYAVFEAIVAQYLSPLDRVVERIMAREADALTGLLHGVRYFLQRVEASPELIAVYDIYYHKCENTEAFAALLDKNQLDFDWFESVVCEGLASLPDEAWQAEAPRDCALIARCFVDGLSALLMRWSRKRQGPLTAQGMAMTKLVLRGGGLVIEW